MRKQKKKIRHNKQTHNRQYKDRLWRMIFNNKEDLLQLYNAINHTDYQNPDDLEVNTLEDVLYLSMKNDVSFLVGGTMNLYEHQSTFNPNMPLRGVFYFGRLYQGYVAKNDLDIYGEKRLRLPIPKYIVFYNGTKDEPDSMEDAVSKAMDACIRQNVLTDFLKKHRAEVLEMILTTYNKKLHEKTLRREGRDEGIQNINRLNGYLLADKRYSDLERSTKDTEYQEKLLKEYGIE